MLAIQNLVCDTFVTHTRYPDRLRDYTDADSRNDRIKQ